jgi:thymidylate synthase (FAD)
MTTIRLLYPKAIIETPVDRDLVLPFLERCGRVCYKSEDLITEDSASRFVDKICVRNHLSVIEHVSVTARFICNRGVSHELVRHRLGSYSQESTRYCNYGKKGVQFIVPPHVDLPEGEYNEKNLIGIEKHDARLWLHDKLVSAAHYLKLLEFGWSPQQARDTLPIALKTEIVATFNLRQWQHVFHERCQKAAHPQMQEVMIPLQRQFQTWLPEIYGENPDEPYEEVDTDDFDSMDL